MAISSASLFKGPLTSRSIIHVLY